MSILNFDTLAFANRLKDAGADGRLAEAIASGLSGAKIGEELVTTAEFKAGLAELRSELISRIYVVGAMLGALIITAQGGMIVALIALIP